MNKVAHYNGFVGRCQQYGLTKQAADMLYKQAVPLPGPLFGALATLPLMTAPGSLLGAGWAAGAGKDEKGIVGGGALGSAILGSLVTAPVAKSLASEKLLEMDRLAKLGKKFSKFQRISPVLGAIGATIAGTALTAGSGALIGKGFSKLVSRNRKQTDAK